MPTVIEKSLEIVSCSGSIAWAADKKAPMVYGHIDVTDEEYRSFGGHLLEGSIIDALAFVAIFELAGASLAARALRVGWSVPLLPLFDSS